jgi:hypothetical protein
LEKIMGVSFMGGVKPLGRVGISRPFPPLVWATPAGSLGSFDEQRPLTISLHATAGGLPPAAFAVVAGSLPAGVTLNSGSGVISGSPADVAVTATTPVTIRATGPLGQVADREFAITVNHVISGEQIYATSGSSTFTVPAGVTELQVKLWGAGGAGTGGGNGGLTGTVNHGGGGGFTVGKVAVTPGETLTLIRGGGGSPSGGEGSGGGGRSALRRGTTELMTAGGGGGGGRPNDLAGDWPGGGAGGGLVGQDAGEAGGGKGGTQSAGGTATGASPGTQFQGGATGNSGAAGGFGGGGAGASDGWGGSGGGGGWYGGGGGRSGAAGSGDPGGGGSGYVGGAGVSAASTTAGNRRTPAGTTDPHYAGTHGYGGLRGAGGSAGRAVILWGTNMT